MEKSFRLHDMLEGTIWGMEMNVPQAVARKGEIAFSNERHRPPTDWASENPYVISFDGSGSMESTSADSFSAKGRILIERAKNSVTQKQWDEEDYYNSMFGQLGVFHLELQRASGRIEVFLASFAHTHFAVADLHPFGGKPNKKKLRTVLGQWRNSHVSSSTFDFKALWND